MLCPLQLENKYGRDAKLMDSCSDGHCSPDCSSSVRFHAFGVEFPSCYQLKLEIPVIRGHFWEEFSITKVLSTGEKSSSSLSIIAMGQAKRSKAEVVIKMFSDYTGIHNLVENLKYEVTVYQHMRELCQIVPHFIPSVAFYSYSEKQMNERSELQPLLNRLHEVSSGLVADVLSEHMHSILVTMKAPGITLYDLLSTRSLEMSEMMSIIFQLLFCIYAMTERGFQHNDLHYKNIIVQKEQSRTCRTGLYRINGRVFQVPLFYHIYIYDFDLSLCSDCGPNHGLDKDLPRWEGFCYHFGVCNQRNPRFDLYTIFRYITEIPKIKANSVFMQFFEKVLGPHQYEKMMCRMCNKHVVYKKDNQKVPPVYEPITQCLPFMPNEPQTVMTPEDIIMTEPYFEQMFRIQ